MRLKVQFRAFHMGADARQHVKLRQGAERGGEVRQKVRVEQNLIAVQEVHIEILLLAKAPEALQTRGQFRRRRGQQRQPHPVLRRIAFGAEHPARLADPSKLFGQLRIEALIGRLPFLRAPRGPGVLFRNVVPLADHVQHFRQVGAQIVAPVPLQGGIAPLDLQIFRRLFPAFGDNAVNLFDADLTGGEAVRAAQILRGKGLFRALHRVLIAVDDILQHGGKIAVFGEDNPPGFQKTLKTGALTGIDDKFRVQFFRVAFHDLQFGFQFFRSGAAVSGVKVNGAAGGGAELFQRVKGAAKGGNVVDKGDAVAQSAGVVVVTPAGEEGGAQERGGHTAVAQQGIVRIALFQRIGKRVDAVIRGGHGIVGGQRDRVIDRENFRIQRGSGFQIGQRGGNGGGSGETDRVVYRVAFRQAQRAPAVQILIGDDFYLFLFFHAGRYQRRGRFRRFRFNRRRRFHRRGGGRRFRRGLFPSLFRFFPRRRRFLLFVLFLFHTPLKVPQSGAQFRELDVVRKDFRQFPQVLFRRVGQSQRDFRAALPLQYARIVTAGVHIDGQGCIAIQVQPFLRPLAYRLHDLRVLLRVVIVDAIAHGMGQKRGPQFGTEARKFQRLAHIVQRGGEIAQIIIELSEHGDVPGVAGVLLLMVPVKFFGSGEIVHLIVQFEFFQRVLDQFAQCVFPVGGAGQFPAQGDRLFKVVIFRHLPRAFEGRFQPFHLRGLAVFCQKEADPAVFRAHDRRGAFRDGTA